MQVVPNMGVQLRPPHPESQPDDQVDAVMADRDAIVPRLWGAVPHHLWGLWIDLCSEVQGHHGSGDSERPRIIGQGYSRVATNPPQSSQKERSKQEDPQDTRQMRDATLSDAIPEIKDQKANDSEDASLRIQKATYGGLSMGSFKTRSQQTGRELSFELSTPKAPRTCTLGP